MFLRNNTLKFFSDSEAGELYAKKLANFVEKRLKNEKAASVSSIIDDSIVYFFFSFSFLTLSCAFIN